MTEDRWQSTGCLTARTATRRLALPDSRQAGLRFTLGIKIDPPNPDPEASRAETAPRRASSGHRDKSMLTKIVSDKSVATNLKQFCKTKPISKSHISQHAKNLTSTVFYRRIPIKFMD